MIEVAWDILRKNNRYLLAQRSTMDSFGGTWTFPGGKVDQSDTDIMATAKRELKEEVALEGMRFRKLCTVHLGQYINQVFCCDEWTGELKPACSDIIGVGWFTWAEMYSLGKSLSPFVNESLLYLSYLVQHYDHHPGEWSEPWRRCDEHV